MEKQIRVRFAPSPTGPLHIGGVRTALYNYLFARKHHGRFILRIEDTDQLRYVPGAEKYIIDSLQWLELTYDEGPDCGGQDAPYRQSERKPLYGHFAELLIEKGKAYYAFDTPEELDYVRKQYESRGETFKYDSKTRLAFKNSLTLPKTEVKKLLDAEMPHVVRLLIPEDGEVAFDDLIRGHVVFHCRELDDKVLFKADGLPTYHLANVVDDYLMKITHVIRGEEWLPSAPLHVLLYEGLGWKEHMPSFAHIPLIMKPEGKGKLSKRDGDAGGFPVFPLEWTDPESREVYKGYRESGYLPEAVINILAFLGWNPGTEQEIMSMGELIEAFSLERVHKSGARFDPEKARWYNHHYIQLLDDDELVRHLTKILSEKDVIAEKNLIERVIPLVKPRIHVLPELWDQTFFFFIAPSKYDEELVRKRWTNDTPAILEGVIGTIEGIAPFEASILEKEIKDHIAENGHNPGQVLSCLRLCMVGSGMGPHVFDIMVALGKEETITRIRKAITVLGK